MEEAVELKEQLLSLTRDLNGAQQTLNLMEVENQKLQNQLDEQVRVLDSKKASIRLSKCTCY